MCDELKERENLLKWGSFNEHRFAIIEACGRTPESIGSTAYNLITDNMEEIFARGKSAGRDSVISRAALRWRCTGK